MVPPKHENIHIILVASRYFSTWFSDPYQRLCLSLLWQSEPPLQLFALSNRCLGVYKFHCILPQNVKWINRENIDTSHSLSSSIWNCFLSTQLCSLTGSSLLLILYSIPTSIGPSAWVSWACTLFLTHTANGMLNSARTDWLGLTVKFSRHLQMVVKVVVAWNWPQWDVNAHDYSGLHLGLRISGGSCPLTSFLSWFLPKT